MVDLRFQLESKLSTFCGVVRTKGPHRTVADRFYGTRSSVVRVVSRVCEAILDSILTEQMKWPYGVAQKEVVAGFKSFNNMDNVIGAIYGCHIPISKRDENNEVFINRKQFPSLVLQGCCDHNMRFTDCFIGYPGSVHDARVFENSDLHERTSSDTISMVSNGLYIVADSAYKLEPYMMTPFKDNGCLTKVQKKYNFVQPSTRNVIERAFRHAKRTLFKAKIG